MSPEPLAVGLTLLGHALWYARSPRALRERDHAPATPRALAIGALALACLVAALPLWIARYGAALGAPAAALALAAVATIHALAIPLDHRVLPASVALALVCLAVGVIHGA